MSSAKNGCEQFQLKLESKLLKYSKLLFDIRHEISELRDLDRLYDMKGISFTDILRTSLHCRIHYKFSMSECYLQIVTDLQSLTDHYEIIVKVL